MLWVKLVVERIYLLVKVMSVDNLRLCYKVGDDLKYIDSSN